ncbi:hypothetical protein C8Q76DRAFT_217436 [Earliella scabrosa]|nr:hypothetical protein C8Q76DRAFT_217436 [Earliella scabrosa]
MRAQSGLSTAPADWLLCRAVALAGRRWGVRRALSRAVSRGVTRNGPCSTSGGSSASDMVDSAARPSVEQITEEKSSLGLGTWPSTCRTSAAPVAWLLQLAPCALRPSVVHSSLCARTWRSVSCTTSLTCTTIDTAREPPRTPRLTSQSTLSPHESFPTLARRYSAVSMRMDYPTHSSYVRHVSPSGAIPLCSIVGTISTFLSQLSQLHGPQASVLRCTPPILAPRVSPSTAHPPPYSRNVNSIY